MFSQRILVFRWVTVAETPMMSWYQWGITTLNAEISITLCPNGLPIDYIC